MRKFSLVVVIFTSLFLMGCAGFGKKMKSFLAGKSIDSEQQQQQKVQRSFASQPNYLPPARRKYKRMTQEKFENQSRIDEKAGSLWVMEGQGSYLFSQNVVRMIGDPIPVRIDGEPKEQLNGKVVVIKKLLNQLEARRRRLARLPAAEKTTEKPAAKGTKRKTEKTTEALQPQKNDLDMSKFAVGTVPARIVERMIDGNYRVKGSQPFMIGSREYKVIVTGIVRAADFTEEGISATRLLDPKFDIVSTRRKDANL